MPREKKFFRWLRGELNGHYLQAVSYFINNWVDSNYNEIFSYFHEVQFQSGTEDSMKDMKLTDIEGLSKFAGVTQLSTRGVLTTNANRLSPSHIVEGTEMSASGLFRPDTETFTFPAIAEGRDILLDATKDRQASLTDSTVVPVKGYIPEGVDAYDENGNFIPECVLPEPPEGKAYSNFYGQQFMQLSENFIVLQKFPRELIYEVLLIVQRIRYNGASTKSFLDLSNLLLPDALVLVSQHGLVYNVEWTYYIKASAMSESNNVRTKVWKRMVEEFFPQIKLTETTEGEL